MSKRKKHSLLWLLIVLLIANVIIYAPHYLRYSSDYRKVDAIVLFLGPDFSARQKKAHDILKEGKAKYLIVPAYNKVYRLSDKGNIKSLSPNLSLSDSIKKRALLNPPSPCYYEDTHIEVMEAKKTMADLGLKSAIFVSSPYHMRRVKLIVTKVFTGEQSGFYFVPTIYEKAPGSFWELSTSDWRKVGREYIKIIWFSIYILWAK